MVFRCGRRRTLYSGSKVRELFLFIPLILPMILLLPFVLPVERLPLKIFFPPLTNTKWTANDFKFLRPLVKGLTNMI